MKQIVKYTLISVIIIAIMLLIFSCTPLISVSLIYAGTLYARIARIQDRA